MAGFKRSILIQKPVEEVFDFATDVDKASQFMPGVTRIEMLTEGGMRQGARFRETRVIKGKERAAIIEIVAHERPRLHAASAAMMGMKATYTFRFAAEGSATRVDLDAEVSGNLLWWLFLGMICKAMEKEDGDYLTRLKEAIEHPPAKGDRASESA
jgi:carbon monoxide dehydrogenase subunit G